ncbi:hypothetical protein TL16_g06558 [Triparma laevis f. inornata]|uniref:Uncharacterized protein n=2 Tax=Triparma laevis TaxID=1534972 RepID=A0A9W7F678_9STRA|nr:hypothetical protein TL16_g06558 [Triparma laevis f. inornata]GMI02314.1 hypothetical protein TrLO_g7410 [Triparma laevis f. longispina]
MNEDFLDKLKLLNYESSFPRPLSRVHFSLPAPNASLQFQDFIDVVCYLIGRIKRDADFFKIDKYDDPNTSVNKMMLALRSLDYESEFPAAKLKAAHGDAVCSVLDFLTSKALDSDRFVFKMPKHNDSIEPEEMNPDDDALADDDEIEDEVEIKEEDDTMFQDGNDENEFFSKENHQIIESNVDPIEWKTELERVGPRLRTNNNAVGKEWRSHINQTIRHSEQISTDLPITESTLKTINNQLSGAVDKMKTKEKYLQTSFSHLTNEYQSVKAELSEIEEKHSSANENVSSLTNELSTIAEQLAEVKGTMDSRGSSMTDTSPLVNIKAALQDIKVEINNFELRIGVVGQSLLSQQTSATSNDIQVEGGEDDMDEEFE